MTEDVDVLLVLTAIFVATAAGAFIGWIVAYIRWRDDR